MDRGLDKRPGKGKRRGVSVWFALVVLSALLAGPAWSADEPKPPAQPGPAPAAAPSAPAAAPSAPAAAQSAPAAAQSTKFSSSQLEQLVAPIALYPDALAVQILMASTYPLEIVEAERWRAKNASLTGDALDKALEKQDWDPSVESLTHFPDLLKRMSDNLDWTKDLGDAFLGQKDEILDAVQLM